MASAQTSPDGTLRLSPAAVQNASVIGEEIMHLHRDLPVALDGIAVIVSDVSADTLIQHLRALAAQGPADGVELAHTVANKVMEKHHLFLSEGLLCMDYASGRLDTEGAWQATVRLVAAVDNGAQ
jgi:hypothetical protein